MLSAKSISGKTQDEIETPAEPAIPQVVPQVEQASPAAEKPVSSSPVVSETEDQIPPPVVPMTRPPGKPRLAQIEMIAFGTRTPQSYIPSGQPFDIHLLLDLSDVKV